jgi:uncharacterized coiled-coil protein SlyX
MADGMDERMARLEHRMDLILERLAHQDKRYNDLITNINTRFDDVHRRLDDLSNHLIRFQTSVESRIGSVENHLMSLGARLEGKATSWAIGVWVSVATVWVTLAVGVATAILSSR